MIRTLAEPNLTALSGQMADFLAGGEYPIPVQGEDGIGIEFKPFGVNMQFTPTVVDGDIINLALNAEVSSIGPTVATGGGAEIPSLNTRRASTTVELRDGESFAIAGLLQDDFRDTVGQVPWLGDLPILGALFRSASYQREQTELVIIITAHLVNPVRGEALALPTDRVTIPTRGRPVPARPHHRRSASGNGSRRRGSPGLHRVLRLRDGMRSGTMRTATMTQTGSRLGTAPGDGRTGARPDEPWPDARKSSTSRGPWARISTKATSATRR
jgi:Flp pilus assembly secretin CpaC